MMSETKLTSTDLVKKSVNFYDGGTLINYGEHNKYFHIYNFNNNQHLWTCISNLIIRTVKEPL